MFILLLSTIFTISVDCPNMINLAIGLNLNTTLMTQIQTDCCTTSGVSCNGSHRVTSITWNAFGLSGIINGSAIPSTVTSLSLETNFIVGSIPKVLPSGLQTLLLVYNALNGTIPVTWPSGITLVDFSHNQLTGSANINWPSTLTALYLNGNSLSGLISTIWPPQLQVLWLCDTHLTGNLPTLPTSLLSLCLGFPGHCNYATFSGSISLNQPVTVYIYCNAITDIIIADPSKITLCDLSYNPLLNNPRLANLTMCTKTGLYSSSTSRFLSLPLISTKAANSQLTNLTLYTKTGLYSSSAFANLSLFSTTVASAQVIQKRVRSRVSQSATLQFVSSKMILSTMSTHSQFLSATLLGQPEIVHPVISIQQELKMAIKLLVSFLLFILVSVWTPFIRELKGKFGKKRGTGNDSSSIF